MIPVDAFSDARVLVTGAGGFIGTSLCRRLRGLGAQVHGTTRSPKAGAAADVQWTVMGLDDQAALSRLLASIRPDWIFHLAAQTSGSRGVGMVLPTLHGNLVATVNLLTAAAEAGCARIVLAGSMEVPRYDEFAPGSPYAVAKQASELYARLFSDLYGTVAATARIFMVYGAGQDDVAKLIPYVILALLRGETPRLSSGARPIDWIYVDDVVEGLLHIALTPGLAGDMVDLGTGRAETVRSVVEQLVDIAGTDLRPDFGALADRPMEIVAAADTARTKARIGWEPLVGLEDGLRRTFEHYRRLRAGSE